jgi:hypothetical protein
MILELLGLLALSLLLGNAYLYFYTNSNGQKLNGYAAGQAEEWERSIHSLHEKDTEFERKILEQEEDVSRKMNDFGKSLSTLNSKTEHSLGRIEKLESIVAGNAAPGEINAMVAGKIERLEDFRRDARIEIEAIKDLFPELKKKKVEVSDPQMEQRIHSLLFHGKAYK